MGGRWRVQGGGGVGPSPFHLSTGIAVGSSGEPGDAGERLRCARVPRVMSDGVLETAEQQASTETKGG